VRIAHISQIQTFVTDVALPAGLKAVCQHRGIQVVEAMTTGDAQADESIVEFGRKA
jgi:DeoR family glycerol-3-phosphate regulon repressor